MQDVIEEPSQVVNDEHDNEELNETDFKNNEEVVNDEHDNEELNEVVNDKHDNEKLNETDFKNNEELSEVVNDEEPLLSTNINPFVNILSKRNKPLSEKYNDDL